MNSYWILSPLPALYHQSTWDLLQRAWNINGMWPPGHHITFFHPTTSRKYSSFFLFALLKSLQLLCVELEIQYLGLCWSSQFGMLRRQAVTWFWASSAGIRYFSIFPAQQGSHSHPAVFSALAPLCTEVVCVKIFNQVLSCQAKNVHHYSSGLNVSFYTFPEEICYFDRLPGLFRGFEHLNQKRFVPKAR